MRTESYQLPGETYEQYQARQRALRKKREEGLGSSSGFSDFSTLTDRSAVDSAFNNMSSDASSSSSSSDSFSGGGGYFGGGGSSSDW